MEKPYKVSTITATGRINTNVDLDILFENLHISKETECEENSIIFAEYGSRRSEVVHEAYAKRLAIADRRQKSGKCKRFNNQVTVVYNFSASGNNVLVNVKIFKNGHIQMTGLKYVRQGMEVIEKLIEIMRDLNNKTDNQMLHEGHMLKLTDYRIRLINCDFKIGFEVRRDLLHGIVNKRYNIACRYEPCIYPGCKIQYCFNADKPVQDGICDCISKCNGKGCGRGDGECKKVTVAVFQSGCIIITGGQSYEQIDAAYKFVNDCIKEHYDEVKRKPIQLDDVV
jgi:TATA-box binding protein (TBP) (component of TFIID and TFIIIB)